MRESIYKSYSMRGTELALLLASKNKKNIHSFGFIDGTETKEDYVYAIDHMVKQGIVEVYDEKIIVKKPYDEMLDLMINATEVITVRASNDDLRDYCIYSKSDDSILVLGFSSLKKNNVVLTYLDSMEFMESFLSGEYFPDEIFESAGDEPEIVSSDIFFDMVDMLRHKRDITDVRFLLGVDIISKVRLERESFIVVHMPTGVYTAHFRGNDFDVETYNKEIFEKKLLKIVKGDFDEL